MMKRYMPLVGLVVLYIFTRLWGLRSLPMFVDEAIYGRWAQMGFFDPAARLVSLGDGKPPLFIWATSLMMHVLRNPVTAARLVSILSGMFTLMGLYVVTVELYKSRKTGAIAMFLYILFPLALLTNRFGIMDTTVGMFAVWSLYLEIILVRTMRTDVMFALALVWAGGILTKTTGYIPLYLAPVSLVLSGKRIPRWVFLLFGAIALTFLYTSVIHLSREADFISKKNEIFMYSFGEVVSKGIWPVLLPNTAKLTGWIFIYSTWPLVLFMCFGVVRLKLFRRESFLLLLWTGIPLVGMALVSRSMASRYLFPVLLPLLPLAAYIFQSEVYKKRKAPLFTMLSGLAVCLMGFTDLKILTDLPRAPIAKEDLFQYANGWPAGGGMKEVVATLMNESKDKKIFVISEGAYGSLPATVMDIYFMQNPNVERLGIETVTGLIPEDIKIKAKFQPVYLITNQMQTTPLWPVTMVAQYRKGIGESFLRLYKVTF